MTDATDTPTTPWRLMLASLAGQTVTPLEPATLLRVVRHDGDGGTTDSPLIEQAQNNDTHLETA